MSPIVDIPHSEVALRWRDHYYRRLPNPKVCTFLSEYLNIGKRDRLIPYFNCLFPRFGARLGSDADIPGVFSTGIIDATAFNTIRPCEYIYQSRNNGLRPLSAF